MWFGIKYYIQPKKCSHHDDIAYQAQSITCFVDKVKPLVDQSERRQKLITSFYNDASFPTF